MIEDKVCMFHVKDTKWGKNPTNIDIHTLVVCIDEYSFGMFDVAVNKDHEFNEDSITKTIKNWKPVLKALRVKGNKEIYGVAFPKTMVKI
jgi:hypothetical protein